MCHICMVYNTCDICVYIYIYIFATAHVCTYMCTYTNIAKQPYRKFAQRARYYSPNYAETLLKKMEVCGK